MHCGKFYLALLLFTSQQWMPAIYSTAYGQADNFTSVFLPVSKESHMLVVSDTRNICQLVPLSNLLCVANTCRTIIIVQFGTWNNHWYMVRGVSLIHQVLQPLSSVKHLNCEIFALTLDQEYTLGWPLTKQILLISLT